MFQQKTTGEELAMRLRCALYIFFFLWVIPVRAQGTGAPDQSAQGSSFSQAKFVPDISLILDCSYLHRNIADDEYEGLLLPGFAQSGDEAGPQEGFNLNYAEMSLYSVVDPYFELFAVCHLSEEHFHLEEAYWLTKRLPAGLQLKAGKFLSSFGRINELHEHYWDFADRPLVHRAMFGEEGLNEIGARVTWVAPTELYLLLGGEVLMGANGGSFGRTGFIRPQDGIDVQGLRGPGLAVGYLKTSTDIDDASVLLGFSVARGRTRSDEGFSSGVSGGEALAGMTTVLGGECTVKYTLDANRYISLQSEFLWRHTDATAYSLDQFQQAYLAALEKRQSGFYAQAVTKFSLRMRAGVRFDLLGRNQVVEAGRQEDLPGNLTRISGMIEFNPTEFSRIRLQYNHDNSMFSGAAPQLTRTPVDEVTLQVNLAIGAHGAHSF
jgi:hypothetical protein